jgi:hypothetical protein
MEGLPSKVIVFALIAHSIRQWLESHMVEVPYDVLPV